MRTVMVRYKLRPGQAEENERLIAAVFDQLSTEQPEGLSYEVFRMPDGLSFVHVACIPEGADPHPLTSLSKFKAFAAGIQSRVEEGPDTQQVHVVGRYLG